MGASMSTLGGWTIILCLAGFYAFRYAGEGKRRDIARAAKRVEDRHITPIQNAAKDKAKRQRKEAYSKDTELSDKAKPKQQATASSPQTATSNKQADYGTDDNVDNREFAKQLASIKQGTSFNGPKKSDDKKQKSVKQSRAQEKETIVASRTSNVSSTSSPAGADGHDDRSPAASPESTPADAGDVSDMLERPSSTGPSVLRLTETDKATSKKAKKAKAPEQAAETKKQRQNKAKVEAAKIAREEAEAERKVKMEAQRRVARIAEGRAAKDGSSFLAAAQPKSSAWSASGAGDANGNSATPTANGEYLPVQPLDTFGSTNGSSPATKAPVSKPKSDNWVSSLPSEEEQMSLLQDEDSWNTVASKKSRKKSKAGASDSNDTSSVTSSVTKPQQVVPVTSKPVMIGASKAANGRPTNAFAHQSSFAALSNDDDYNDGPQEEQEWDV